MTTELDTELQDLTQFLYQIPVGVVAMNEHGEVSMMNPAAARILATEVEESESVTNPMPILQRLAPEIFAKMNDEPEMMGTISNGSRCEVDSRDGVTRFTITVHRLRADHIIVSMTDVTEERRLLLEQRDRAQRLQRALLGRIDVADLELSVAYVPANREDLSGGDWYDVVNVDDNRVALVVGDVVGHDIEASATMGQLRAIVRSLALVDPDPAEVLDRTEALARRIDGAVCATLHYALLDKAASSVTYASAGHPPPLIVRSDGSSTFLSDGRRPALAATPVGGRVDATVDLTPGDVVIFYTDGLIERRSESIDQGFARLQEHAASLSREESIDDFVETLTNRLLAGSDQSDDVCVLAIRF